jgi:putative aldouronate transport system substrate-binding protein
MMIKNKNVGLHIHVMAFLKFRPLAVIVASMVLGLTSVNVSANDADYKIVSNPLELSVHVHFRDKYVWDENWPVAKEYERLTGIRLKGVADKIGTNSKALFDQVISSNDLPDIIGGVSLQSDFNQLGRDGVLLSLEDLIDKHAPNLKQFFADNPIVKNAVTADDGHLYYIPYVPDGVAGRGYYVRQDWLDRLGLKQPTNVDELYRVLIAFRDKDPNGNGRADEIPLFFRHWEEMLRLLVLWDGRSTGSDTAHQFYIENDKVMHGYAEDNYRLGIRQIAKWYGEKLIDREVFTRGTKSREVLLGTNRGGMTHDWFASSAGFNSSLAENIPGFDFVPFPPPGSISGKIIEEHGRSPVKPDGWAITRANQHPVETIKFMDFLFSEKGRNISNFGVEGQTWTMQNGKPTFTDEVLNSKSPVNSQMWDIGAQIPIGYHMDYNYELQWTNKIAAAGVKMYMDGGYILDQFPGFILNSEEQTIYDELWPDILAYMLSNQRNWILGLKNIDEEWAGYKKTLQDLGYPQLVSMLQASYDRTYK